MTSSAWVQPSIPLLVRSHERDACYWQTCLNQCNDLLEEIYGGRWTAAHQHKIRWIVVFLYYALQFNTSTGRTLGEEYADLMPVQQKILHQKILFLPIPLLKRLSWAILHALGCTYLDQDLMAVPALAALRPVSLPFPVLTSETNTSTSKPFWQRVNALRQPIASFVARYSWVWVEQWLTPLHILIFFFQGQYHRLLDRLFGIQYIQIGGASLNEKLKDESAPLTVSSPVGNLQWLGYVVAIRLWMQLGAVRTQWKRAQAIPVVRAERKSNSSNNPMNSEGKQCMLCLSRRKEATSTPCGHVFCWSCIFNWTCTQPWCPLCRQTFRPSLISRMYNYD